MKAIELLKLAVSLVEEDARQSVALILIDGETVQSEIHVKECALPELMHRLSIRLTELASKDWDWREEAEYILAEMNEERRRRT